MNGRKPYYPTLKAEIVKAGMLEKDIAEHIGITPRAFSDKMNGKKDWWLSEVLAIHACFPDVKPLELFKHEN